MKTNSYDKLNKELQVIKNRVRSLIGSENRDDKGAKQLVTFNQ